MAAVTKILMRRDKSVAPLLSLGDKQKTLETQKRTHGDCDAAIAKAADVVTHVYSLSQDEGLDTCLVLICHQQKRAFGG